MQGAIEIYVHQLKEFDPSMSPDLFPEDCIVEVTIDVIPGYEGSYSRDAASDVDFYGEGPQFNGCVDAKLTFPDGRASVLATTEQAHLAFAWVDAGNSEVDEVINVIAEENRVAEVDNFDPDDHDCCRDLSW